MGISVTATRSRAELTKVCELRYRVYVDELQIPTPEADHAWRWLRDPLEEHSISFAAWKDDRAIGSLRLTLLRDVPDPQPLLSRFCMHPALGEFGIEALCTTSRFMLDPEVRHGRVIYPLMKAVYEYLRNHKVRLNFGDCSPYQLAFYEHMGFQPYESGFDDPSYGYKLPILMLLGDHEGFRAQRTPLLRATKPYEDDPPAREWFARTYAGGHPARTVRDLGKGGLRRLLPSATNFPLLRGLPPEDLDIVLDQATIFHVRADTRIARRGQPGNAVFLLVNGAAAARDSDHELALDPGDSFGPTFPGIGPMPHTVVAQSSCQVITIPASALERLQRRQPRIAAHLAANCAKLPSARARSKRMARVATGTG